MHSVGVLKSFEGRSMEERGVSSKFSEDGAVLAAFFPRASASQVFNAYSDSGSGSSWSKKTPWMT